jgi:hypothetical protein
VLFSGSAVASGTCKINHKEKLQTLPVDFDWIIESDVKIVWQASCLGVPYGVRSQ